VLMERGEKDEAVKILKELARRFPDHPDFKSFR